MLKALLCAALFVSFLPIEGKQTIKTYTVPYLGKRETSSNDHKEACWKGKKASKKHAKQLAKKAAHVSFTL